MAYFRLHMPDDLWRDMQALSKEVGVPDKALLNTCAGLGFQYFKLALHPPKDLMRQALKLKPVERVSMKAVEKAMKPLAPYAKRKRQK